MNTPDVVDQLCRDNQRLAWSRALYWVKRFQALYLKDEFLSAAMEALWRAAERHEPTRGRFSTYATNCIDRRIWSVWRTASRRRDKMPTVSGGTHVLDHRRDPPGLELQEEIDRYAELMDDPQARLALKMAADGWTMSEMADELGCTAKDKRQASACYWRTLRSNLCITLQCRYYASHVSANN